MQIIMRIKKTMNKLKLYLNRIYRLSFNLQKQEEIVWSDLKKLHELAQWKHYVYEKDKYIETILEINDGKAGRFYYYVEDSRFHCSVKILEDYPIELTTDLFILAAHFNNLLNNGLVRVNVKDSSIAYHLNRDLLIPLLYIDETHSQIESHFYTAKDIYSAFQRLIIEQEFPAIIIADLLKKNERAGENAE